MNEKFRVINDVAPYSLQDLLNVADRDEYDVFQIHLIKGSFGPHFTVILKARE